MKKSFVIQILTSLVLAFVLFLNSPAISLSATEGAVSTSFEPFDKALGAIILVLVAGLFSFIIGIFVMHRRVNIIAHSEVAAVETVVEEEPVQEEVVEEFDGYVNANAKFETDGMYITGAVLDTQGNVVKYKVEEGPYVPSEEPVQEEVVEEPVQEEVAEEPVQEEVAEEPVQEEVVEEPVQEEVAEEPVQEEVAEEPVQEEVVEEPVQEEVAEEPVQEEVVEEPVQEEVVEEPVQEEVAEEPVQEEVAEQPVQKKKDSFIDINPVESTLEKNDMADLISESVSVEEVSDKIDDNIIDQLVIKANDLPKYKKAKKEKHIINIDTISEHFENEEIVDLHSLKEKRLLPQKCNYFKVLARGVLDKKLTVEANDFSRDAVKMILLTGGNVVKIN